MKYCVEDKDLLNSVLSQLKAMGVKVPKRKMKVMSKQNKGELPAKAVFGICLAEQEKTVDSNTPKFVFSCTEYLQNFSKEIGLFRKAGSISRQKNLRTKIEKGGCLDGAEPNDVASLLKQWLRELPEPLVPSYLHDSFIKCQQLGDGSRITATLLMCLLLPPDHLLTLRHLMCFLSNVATEKDRNKMDNHNLALIMTPNIFVLGNSNDKSSKIKFQQFTVITQLLIENAKKIGDIPHTLKLPMREANCESQPISHRKELESSTSSTAKQYLLRSFKKLVKQNTVVSNPITLTQEHGPTVLRHTMSVNNLENASLKPFSEAKGNFAFFGSREDVCKRSFRLLHRKDKKGLAPYKDCHPFTQSIEIDTPTKYYSANSRFSSKQDLLWTDKSEIGSLLTLHTVHEKQASLEDIEMTTFSSCVISKNDNLLAFPINSSQSTQHRQGLGLENKHIKNSDKFTQTVPLATPGEVKTSERCPSTDFLTKNVEISRKIEVRDSKSATDISGLHQNKKTSRVLESSRSNANLSAKEKLPNNESKLNKSNSKAKMNAFNVDFVSNDKYALDKSACLNLLNCTEEFQLFRQSTSVVGPPAYDISHKTIRPLSDDKCNKITKQTEYTNDLFCKISNKRQCTSVIAKDNTHKNSHAKRIVKKSTSIIKTDVEQNKTDTPLQKTKEIFPKPRSDSDNFGKRTKTPYTNEKQSLPANARTNGKVSQGSLKCNNQTNRKLSNLSFYSRNNKSIKYVQSLSKTSLEGSVTPKRKLSFSKSLSESSHSDSKIPRLRKKSEVAAANSFSELPIHRRDVPDPKTSASKSNYTKIPVKCGDMQNLSNLDASINDSCFLTPKRNSMATPNSVTWMSGNKYFTAETPELEAAACNKRESIAMILKTNSGHVQAKVHLYDDLIRESVEMTPPNHSTPSSNFNRNVLSSQSMKSAPQPRATLNQNKRRFRKNSVHRSNSLKNENSQGCQSSKFISRLNSPSSRSLKDVTNTSVGGVSSKTLKPNFKMKSKCVGGPVKTKILKRNSFSGSHSQKSFKKVTRSESSPGCPRPYTRVTCPIQK